MDNAFLKPAPLSAAEQKEFGRATRHVLDPQQGFRALAAEGEFKPLTAYWVRRLRDGDVVETAAPAPLAKPQAVQHVEEAPPVTEAEQPEAKR